MKPEKFLKKTTAYLKSLQEALKKSVAVGLPLEKVGGEVYENGVSVLDVGAAHEYGINVPLRSFLRMPFDVKRKIISNEIDRQFKKVFDDGRSVEKALGLVGIAARNVVIDAFKTGGFGQWKDISPITKELKGSSAILVNLGILKGAITWVVR